MCRSLPHVKDVRIRGAIGIVELDEIRDLPALKRSFVNAGVWLRPFRNVIYLTPALSIGRADLDRLIESIPAVLEQQVA